MERFALAAEYLDDPVLLMRPLAHALARSSRGYGFTLVRRDGRAEEYDLYYSDLLTIGDLLRALIQGSELEAIILRGFCSPDRTALLHIPSRSFYASGDALELASMFEALLPTDVGALALDHTATTLWRARYPSRVALEPVRPTEARAANAPSTPAR